MTIREILIKLRDVLATDTELQAYCEEKWEKRPWIFLGLNRQNLPLPEQMPAVVIDSVPEKSRAGKQETNKVVVGILIENNDVTTDETAQTITCAGFPDVEELREYVERAAFRKQGEFKMIMNIGDAGSVPNQVFPVFSAVTAIVFLQSVTSREPQR